MYYVVDQSNPKEPMEYIRVTRKDIYEFKKVQIKNFIGKPINDDEISLCQYVLKDIEVPSYYDTKPVRVGTMYTHLLNMHEMSLDDQYNINFYNDIDFILFFENIQSHDKLPYHTSYSKCLIKDDIKRLFNYPSKDKSIIIIGKFIMNPPINESIARTKTLNNIHYIYSFFHDFIDFESSFTYIFKKFIIQALKTIINTISSPNYNSFFKTSYVTSPIYRFYKVLRSHQDYPYSIITNYLDEIKYLIPEDICIRCMRKDYILEIISQFLNYLLSKYESSLYIDDDFITISLDESIRLMVEIFVILHLYQSMHIEVSNYNDFSTDFSNFSFEKYTNLVSYKIDLQEDLDMHHRYIKFEELCELLHNYSLNNEASEFEDPPITLRHLAASMSRIYSRKIPLEYLILPTFFFLLTYNIVTVSKKIKNIADLSTYDIKMEGIDIENIIDESIIYYRSEIITDNLCISENNDITSIILQSMQNQVLENQNTLYYNLKIHNIIDLFKPTIGSYLLFSKYPIDRCSHCHMFFLKTSPNRKFCDSTLTLKSGMTCKEEREAITDQKSEYQKTTNDFKQYLQKVTLKGGPSYTLRVKNILEKNKYFDTIKSKDFDKLSKTDNKDLLWVLNSFFNYSYAIMESMSFQEIVIDPTFKDVRYYNNSPNSFTHEAYEDLFKEYKKYTRTNKGNGVTEVFNIYNSLVKFSESKDSELSFKTIRSKSMQNLNGDDIAKLFEITEIVIHVFFLKLANWYIESDWNFEDTNKEYPSFAFPKEFATFELGNIQYISKDDIKALRSKIKDAKQNSDIYKDFIKMNEDREKQVIKLITELREKIFDNHPFK